MYVFVRSNLSVQCFVAYEVHCYTFVINAHALHNIYAHAAVILTAYQGSFLSPYRAFTYSSYIFRSTFHWLSNGTGFRRGADKNVLYLCRAIAIEGRSLYGLPRPNGTAQPYATPQGDSMYVYLKDCKCFGCLSLLVVRAETEKLTGSCVGVNYTMECSYVEQFRFLVLFSLFIFIFSSFCIPLLVLLANTP